MLLSSQPACRVDQQPLIVALYDRRLAVLTIVVEGCGVVVVPSLAGEDANVDFRNLAALISMTRRGRRDTRMSVTLMKGSSARCPSSQ
jgi:hypothetical protein